MKVFFSLIVFSFVVATCQGACFQFSFEAKLIDDKLVTPNKCVDVYDGSKHLLGSTWNTAHCLRCECHKNGFSCCHRFGGPADVEGCKTVVNPVTCKHEHYRLDDPSQRCET